MKRILPAYPLFVKDPYFSLWSVSEGLNASDTQSWWGTEKRLYGFIRTGGETYCFLGRVEAFAPCGVKAAEQLSLSVTAYTTNYRFRAGETILNVRFVSPLPPSDPELLSLPVCYMEYSAEGADAEISLFVNRRIAYNDIAENTNREVRGGAFPLRGFECAFLGLKRQLPFSNNDDLIGADWGYYYLSGERAYFLDERSLSAYLSGGRGGFSCEGEERYLGSVNFSREGAVMLGYDDLVSVDYFGEWLKGGYLARNTIVEALEYIHAHRKETDEKLDAEDAELRRRAAAYGEDYYDILVASLRQSVAAHKLVRDREGNVLFLSKECGSNGCIGTVDLSYPSMPLYLLANTELLKGMMRPILKFAKMPVWPYDFAPHDVGTYPACCGQVYGLSVSPSRFHGDYAKTWYPETHFPVRLLPPEFEAYDPDMQMPVEESANMLVMFLACYRADGDIRFFKSERGLAEKWAKYLAEHGLKPENQLCTDDFAGHLKNNVNLAIKATVGVAAYAELAATAGDGEEGKKYRGIAERFAAEITAFGEKYGHLPLTWDSDGETFSLKYNLAFDKLLGLGLFPQSLLEREVDYYLGKCNAFGTPLDNRKGYTKSDWLLWTAALTDDMDKKKKLIGAVAAFLRRSPDRVPFSDWFESESGEFHHFRARSVQGGCFVLLLEGGALQKKPVSTDE